MAKPSTLCQKLRSLEGSPPKAWSTVGVKARPNLHGIFRYPAMMLPRMQGDIIDIIRSAKGAPSRVVDPFVGSGTVMTEALLRDLDFTGIDINPLAVLVCEAKIAIDRGINIEAAAEVLLSTLRFDVQESIDVDFPGRSKWFDDQSALRFSVLRRAIMSFDESGTRKVFWTVFAETLRLCSNSRTSTYKLHIRKPEDHVAADRVTEVFESNLSKTLMGVREYRAQQKSQTRRPSVEVICGDVREAKSDRASNDHQILVTSPPYGDNKTTIPYGQFSYLAMRWIPEYDLPSPIAAQLNSNTNSLDSASLGGSVRGAEEKEDCVRAKSPHFDAFVHKAKQLGKRKAIRKVSAFLGDFSEAISHLRTGPTSTAHWVLTTGNRTVAGLTVPFDSICRDLLTGLGGNLITTLHRQIPSKRMPSRNSQGAMITAETTTIVEFA
ncbi:MAG: hypothetical protein F4065_11210 [Rhodothermaceae bacterium]|nr:hypothetical protein [Rhodothermaceae bacterium]MXZ17216.1 hypothetical protein [Rhodothermaceae bacterium]MXZ57781.1 hypothetical protein [Rhodothermaceae bacterium]MYB91707.1 hypothetical protein [Rhodothermaceae bacterium]MYD67579.1 hypothetical protein [Rhodothermaceae bacterium]